MAAPSNFLNILREVLNERFDALEEHGEEYVKTHFKKKSQRMIWYNVEEIYDIRYNKAPKDLSGDAKKQYMRLTKAIREFCEGKKIRQRAEAINPRYVRYWGLLRNALNISAKGRAVAYMGHEDNEVLVIPKNRPQYVDKGLMFVLCEKETVGLNFLEEMQNRGWRHTITLVVMGGTAVCEVIETLIDINDSIFDEETNVAIGVLHDIDISGIIIFNDIKQYFPKLLDFGINFEMLDRVSLTLWDELKESAKVTKEQKVYMKNRGFDDILERIGEFKVELDNTVEKKGVGVFCDYAEYVLDENAIYWDLNRVKEPVCYDPNKYTAMKERVSDLFDNIVKSATGQLGWEIDWTKPADEALAEFKQDNINFDGSVDEVKDYHDYINEQSEELQKIVDDDGNNIKNLKNITTLFDMLNLDELEKTIKEKAVELKIEEEDDENGNDSE